MADTKISALTTLNGVDVADADRFLVVDTSTTTTKAILASELDAVPQLTAAFLGVTQPHNVQTGTSYTLVLADANKLVTLNNASAITLTVPPNSSVAFPVGTRIDLAQLGAGQVTVTEGSGVTVNRPSTLGLKLIGQYSEATLTKYATDTWLLAGHITA
jgi:hypothetical protein